MKLFNFNKFILGFKYAFNGIKISFYNQLNIKIHCIIALLVIIFGCIFDINKTDWCIVIICVFCVISAEIFNSVVENIADFISPEYNKKIGSIKDMAAGAVLITAFGSAIVGLLVFMPYIFDKFNI